MIYKYNVAYTSKRISEESFDRIKEKVKAIRNCGDQDISPFVGKTIFVSERPDSYDVNTYILCSKAKAFYAISAIRTDENYINQWLILKDPTGPHKKIILNKTETANTNLYRRMTIEEIKLYFNDDE